MGASESIRAHHRILQDIVSATFGTNQYSPEPHEFDRASRVFVRAGGSWERLYAGSFRDMRVLKLVVKVAAKNGFFKKSADWDR